MKILRFGISDDAHGPLPKEARSWYLAAKRLEEATNETWETELRPSWPSGSLVPEVEKALELHHPDLVVICCAAFWVSYPSAPLKLHRSKFPGSDRLARAAFWAAARPALAHRSAFHLGRRLVTREATVEFFFQPEVALQRVEQAIRAVLSQEEVALAIRGPLPLTISGSPALRELCERRRAAFETGLDDLCRSLHVAYHGYNADDKHPADELAGDRVHVNAKGHARRATDEFEVMRQAWEAHTSAATG